MDHYCIQISVVKQQVQFPSDPLAAERGVCGKGVQNMSGFMESTQNYIIQFKNSSCRSIKMSKLNHLNNKYIGAQGYGENR